MSKGCLASYGLRVLGLRVFSKYGPLIWALKPLRGIPETFKGTVHVGYIYIYNSRYVRIPVST